MITVLIMIMKYVNPNIKKINKIVLFGDQKYLSGVL